MTLNVIVHQDEKQETLNRFTTLIQHVCPNVQFSFCKISFDYNQPIIPPASQSIFDNLKGKAVIVLDPLDTDLVLISQGQRFGNILSRCARIFFISFPEKHATYKSESKLCYMKMGLSINSKLSAALIEHDQNRFTPNQADLFKAFLPQEIPTIYDGVPVLPALPQENVNPPHLPVVISPHKFGWKKIAVRTLGLLAFAVAAVVAFKIFKRLPKTV